MNRTDQAQRLQTPSKSTIGLSMSLGPGTGLCYHCMEKHSARRGRPTSRVTSPRGHDLPVLQPHDQIGVLVDQRVVRRHQEGGALSLTMRRNRPRFRAVVLSNSPVGSSASMSDGWFASARAIATCCCPTGISNGRWCFHVNALHDVGAVACLRLHRRPARSLICTGPTAGARDTLARTSECRPGAQ